MNFCKDCVHFQENIADRPTCIRRELTPDLVTGEPTRPRIYCADERYGQGWGQCTFEGNFFKAAPTTQKKKTRT